MSGVRFKMMECSPELRKRLKTSLARLDGLPLSGIGKQEMPTSGAVLPSARGKSAAKCGPNRTEQAYNVAFLGGKGMYEAITLRLPGGSRYTPDWMSICPLGLVHLHEVKGSYRLPSHGRALTAWKEARAAFKCFRFHWCEWDGAKWVSKHKESS